MRSPALVRARGSACGSFGAFAVLGLVGCTDARVQRDAGSSSGDPSSASSTGTGTGTASPSTTTEPETTGVVFLGEPDMGGVFECDIFAQDCPPGQKCMPWANDGGGAWNATRCSPIADEPAGIDEPCHVEGSGTSGIDDCKLGAVCWGVDPKTNEGTCIPMCVGSVHLPICEDPDRACDRGDELPLCLPVCKPLQQDCAEGQACYPVREHWYCAPDASGDLGAYGEPCEFITSCNPGLICLDANTVPPGQPCEGAAGCCTEICDLSDPPGDLQCAGAAEGQTCQSWYVEGSAPPGYEDVGACAVPA